MATAIAGKKMTRATVGVAALLAAAVAAAVGVAGHSSLTEPPPLSGDIFCKRDSEQNCPGPCPVRKLKNPPPVTTWARGETVPLRWFRNNHEGGFVRWSLVPVALANDQAAHDAAAFAYGCYTVNRYKCTPEEKVQHCGGDNTGSGVRHPGRVPTNVPDGEYVLGWTWYGGYNTPDIEFTDYVDCARVRIAGGVPRTESYTPVMLQGSDKAPNGSCLATRNRRGMCRGDVCDGGRDMKISIMKPAEFTNGARPAPIPASFFDGSGGGGGVPAPPADAPPVLQFRHLFKAGSPLASPGPVTLPALYVIGVDAAAAVATLRAPSTAAAPPSSPLAWWAGAPRGGVVLEAAARGSVRSVEWWVDGAYVGASRTYPYTLGGTAGGVLKAWGGWTAGRPVLVRVKVVGWRGRVVNRAWRLRFD